jgi:hypothetical protein
MSAANIRSTIRSIHSTAVSPGSVSGGVKHTMMGVASTTHRMSTMIHMSQGARCSGSSRPHRYLLAGGQTRHRQVKGKSEENERGQGQQTPRGWEGW